MGLADPTTPEEIAKAKLLGEFYESGWDDAVDACCSVVEEAMALAPDYKSRLTTAMLRLKNEGFEAAAITQD